MSLEIIYHTVPGLIALNIGFEVFVRQWHDSTFRWLHTYMKITFLHHAEATVLTLNWHNVCINEGTSVPLEIL